MKSLIEKEYFRLDEVVDDLQIPLGDISYLAENGHLQLSVLVYALSVERGWPQRIAGDEWRIVSIDNPFSLSGLVDLTEADAPLVHLYRDGTPEWRVRGESGRLVRNRTEILLDGRVWIDREPVAGGEPVHITTRDLRIIHGERYAETAAATVIEDPFADSLYIGTSFPGTWVVDTGVVAGGVGVTAGCWVQPQTKTSPASTRIAPSVSDLPTA